METMAESLPFSTFAVFAGDSCAAGVACLALDVAATPPMAVSAPRTAAPVSTHAFRFTGPPRRSHRGPCVVTALLPRGVENAHTTVRCGGWDSIRVDEGLTIDGVREVLH